MSGVLKYIFNSLIAVVCVIVIISFAVSITVIFKPLYYFDIDNLKICETSGFSREKCIENYDALIDYNIIGGPEKLVFPSLAMSEEGEIHFKEVKDIFVPMQWISIVGIPLFSAAVVWEYRRRKKNSGGVGRGKIPKAGKWMGLVGKVALCIVAVVAAAIAIDWQWAFETMHSLFFDNDYWIFDSAKDPVIKMLPDAFFMHCGILILSITTAIVVFISILYRKSARDK